MENTQGMKWFKFVIYVQMFLAAISDVANFGNYIGGNIYAIQGSSPEAVYWVFPALSGLDKVFAILCLALAAFAIYVRMELAKYKSGACDKYLIFIVATAGISVLYQIIFAGITSQISESMPSIIGMVIAYGVFIALNKIYFDKRKHLFVN